MKIAHIASVIDRVNAEQGGRGRLIYNLAKEQAKNGHDVLIFAAPDSHVPGCITRHFLPQFKLRNNYILNWALRRFKETEHYIQSYKFIGTKYDIIHSHITEEGTFLSRMAKSPSIVTLHGTHPKKLLPYFFTKLFSLFRKTKYVAECRSQYIQQQKIYGNDVMGYVYGGVDLSRFIYVDTPNKTHEIELCFLGRFVYEKGLHIALNLIDKLKDMGYDVFLKVIGLPYPNGSSYFRYIYDEIMKRSYADININVSTKEVIHSLGNSDALIFPILWDEPFGFVMIESMATGTPIIAFNRGSVPEVVLDKKTGFICKNEQDFIHGILNVDRISRKTCRKRVEERFSTQAMYINYLKLYNKII